MASEGDLINNILRRQAQMESIRSNWDTFWMDIAERVLPRENIFTRTGPITQGERRTEKQFDSTAVFALERFCAAMEWMLVPRTQKWHKLGPADQKLKDDRDVQVYLDQVTDILFQARYSPRSNFASQAHEAFMSLGAFGSGCLFVDDALGQNIRYRVCHLSEVYFAENHVGLIDTLHRKYSPTYRQLLQRYGADACGPDVTRKAEITPDVETEVIHAVQPNSEVDGTKRDYRAMPYSSCVVLREGRRLLEEGGYHSFPYALSRYVVGPRETYGRSPAMSVFPDIKMLSEQRKTDLRARQKAVDPPILAPDDDTLQPFDLRPGAMNYGGVNAQGQQLVHPFITGARMDLSEQGIADSRQIINDAFLVTLFLGHLVPDTR
jgi:hypothetical protein